MLAIYCRISKKKDEGTDDSIPNQKRFGVLLAKRLGLDYEYFVDDGISGTKEEIEDRPNFAKMYKAIKDGKVTAVFVQYQDRLERSPLIWQLFVAIVIKTNCKFYPGGVLLDLNNPQNKFMSDVMSANNALYARLTSDRVKNSIKSRAIEGKFRGITAFGYEHGEDGKLSVNKEEADIVKRIYKMSLSGIGTYQIANKLNEENVSTRFNKLNGTHKRKDKFTNKVTIFKKSGVRWRGNVVYDMLVNTIYKGEKKLHGMIYKIPEIIDEKTWDLVNSNLINNKKNVGKKAQYRYILNGLILCADCGRGFVGKKRLANADNAYKCKGKIYPDPDCPKSRGISINKLDSFIIKHLFATKSLKKHLLSLQENSDVRNGLLNRLSNEKAVLERKESELRIAYKRLLNPQFSDDVVIESHVVTLKTTIERQKKLVEDLENDVIVTEYHERKKRTKDLIGSYVDGIEFDDLRKLIHSLIDWIKIKHLKSDGKMGDFIIEIKYKGYDEVSIFHTNWQAKKFLWLSYYRSSATDEVQLEEDKDDLLGLLDYYRIEISPKIIKEFKEATGYTDEDINKMNPLSEDFGGSTVSYGRHEVIELADSDIVYFD